MEGLSRHYGPVVALDRLDLTLQPGELIALLGPSGCGKTTTLRLLAGLEDADSGHITVGGKDLTHVSAAKRDMGMVFQAYSLFPHMTVRQNVAFGLRLRRVDAGKRDRRALEMLDLVGLSTQADRYPHQLSGGQQQRVALARALAIEPQVLLLDEPLSALDAKVRAQLRDEIRRIQLEVGITTLFVTHDQEEALAIADRVGVMREGHLEQLAPPIEVYSRPATSFVAEFVGLSNRLAGVVRSGDVVVRGCTLPLVERDTPDGEAVALVRPEAVTLASRTPAESGPLVGTVIAVTFLGATSRVTVDLGDTSVMAQLSTSDATELSAGSRVALTIRPDPVLVAAGPAAARRRTTRRERSSGEPGPQAGQVAGAEPVLSQPPGDPAVAGFHLLQERRHRLRPDPVGVRGFAVDVPGVGPGPAQPGHDSLGAVPGRGVILHHRLRADPGDDEREGHHHAGPVLAGRAVHERRAFGVRDAAQRGHHLVRTVGQVTQVVPAHRIVRVPRLIAPGLAQQGVGDHVGAGAQFSQHRVMGVTDARHGVQRSRALQLHLLGTAQVHHGGHADVADQLRDVAW